MGTDGSTRNTPVSVYADQIMQHLKAKDVARATEVAATMYSLFGDEFMEPNDRLAMGAPLLFDSMFTERREHRERFAVLVHVRSESLSDVSCRVYLTRLMDLVELLIEAGYSSQAYWLILGEQPKLMELMPQAVFDLTRRYQDHPEFRRYYDRLPH